MRRNKLYNALVVGGAALTIGPAMCGCSAGAAAPAPAGETSDSKPQADTATAPLDTSSDASSEDTAPPDDTMPDVADAGDSGDGALKPCSEICSGGFCEGICCLWGGKHRCCK